MEKQQSLEILQKGVEAWNYWRKQYKDMRPDLHGLDLNGVNLSQADLSFANLNGALQLHLVGDRWL